jgi:hypothetical protein
LFRKVRLRHAEEAVELGQLGHEEARVVAARAAELRKLPAWAEPHKLKLQRRNVGNNRPAREALRPQRISRRIAGFR